MRWVLLLLLSSSCAASRAVTCPAPIGDIVRDDCDTFRVRYESLGVTVGASLLGVVGAQATVGKTQTQAPSELIQVMAHQAHQLCQDYNACRLDTQAYLQRRDHLDKKFALVAGISAELNRESLSKEDRGRLLERLMRALGAPATPEAKTKGRRASSGKKTYPPQVWLGASHPPPMPAPPSDGYPQLLAPVTRVHISKYTHKAKVEARDGYIPSLRATLYGVVDPDDVLLVKFGPEQARCLVKRSTKGVVGVVKLTCKAPPKKPHRALSGVAEVSYTRAATGETRPIGQVPYAILERPGDRGTREGIHQIGVDWDRELDAAWLAWVPEPYHLPAEHQRPTISVALRFRERSVRATLRCRRGEEVVTGAVSRGHNAAGSLGSYQDRPRYRPGPRPNSSVGVKHPFIRWHYKAFALPFVVGNDPPEGLKTLEAGKYACDVTARGEKLRTVRFEVRPGGALVPHPTQRGAPGDVVSWMWKLDVQRHPNGVESEIEPEVRRAR